MRQFIRNLTLIDLLIVIPCVLVIIVFVIMPFSLDRIMKQEVERNWLVTQVNYQPVMLRSTISDPQASPVYPNHKSWTITLTSKVPDSSMTIMSSEKFSVNEVVHFEKVNSSIKTTALRNFGGFHLIAYQLVHGPLPPKP